jgi:hypothetical protein
MDKNKQERSTKKSYKNLLELKMTTGTHPALIVIFSKELTKNIKI